MQQRVSEQSFTVSFIGRDIFLFSPPKPREIFFEMFIYRWIDKFRESDDCYDEFWDEFHPRKVSRNRVKISGFYGEFIPRQ